MCPCKSNLSSTLYLFSYDYYTHTHAFACYNDICYSCILANSYFNIPFVIAYIVMFNMYTKDSDVYIRNQFIYTITILLYYMAYSVSKIYLNKRRKYKLQFLYFQCSFYVYCCVSKRFRRQVKYVLFEIHYNRWREYINRILNNQIRPHQNELFS